MKLAQIQSLNEMAAKQTCGNCGQPMAGNHFYRKVGGVNKRFCKGSSLKKAQAQGLTPIGNASYVGQPPSAAAPTQTAAPAPVAAPAPAPTAPTPSRAVAPAPASRTPTPTVSDTGEMTDDVLEQKAKEWLKKYGVEENVVSVSDGKINVDDDVYLDEFMGAQLPKPFGVVNGDFACSGSNITSLLNFPEVIKGDLHVTHTKIKNFDEVVTMTVEEDIHLSHNNELEHLKKIHKKLKMKDGDLNLKSSSMPNNMLGLLAVKGLKEIQPTDSKAYKIINKHLSAGRDILDAQEELIDAGFGGMARM